LIIHFIAASTSVDPPIKTVPKLDGAFTLLVSPTIPIDEGNLKTGFGVGEGLDSFEVLSQDKSVNVKLKQEEAKASFLVVLMNRLEVIL
jgi:hypothetical protein